MFFDPGLPGDPIWYAFWHGDKEFDSGNVLFTDGHVAYHRATFDQPDIQNGPDWTYLHDGPRSVIVPD